MVGCGQQRGSMKTRASSKLGGEELTGRSGDSSWGGWGMSRRARGEGEAGGRTGGRLPSVTRWLVSEGRWCLVVES